MTMQTMRRLFRRRRDVFISYRRKDGLWLARALYYYLKGKGVDCFFDFEDIHTGKFDEKIGEEIDNASYFISVLTPCALEDDQNGGNWFRLELEYALRHKAAERILPVRLRDCICDFSSDSSEIVRENFTINQHVLDEGAAFEDSIDRMLSFCSGIGEKISSADSRLRTHKERKFRRKVLKLYRNGAMDNACRKDKIRKLGDRYQLTIGTVEEIAEDVCDQVSGEMRRRAWIGRHPLLVSLFAAGVVALGAYAAMLVSPEFDQWMRQQWDVLSERGLGLWRVLRSALRLH